MTGRVGWLDCSSGVSGDMLLGALVSLQALDLPPLVESLGLEVDVEVRDVRRGGMTATQVDVRPGADQPHRRLGDITAIIGGAAVDDAVKAQSSAVFARLARAEAAVHGVPAYQVEFHEVGAVDAVVDIVGACAGLHALGLDRLVCSPIALGAGVVSTRHGELPVPGPAVVALLAEARLASYGGPEPVELATPTGVAVVAEHVTESGPLPTMVVDGVGTGAGGRELDRRPNVLRLVVGTATAAAQPQPSGWQLLEANVDDLDPRLWPVVIERLLAAGAVDAWLTPIVMKKGRSAHTLSVLAVDDAVDAVASVVFTESSTIGLRSVAVGKRELDREWIDVTVEGRPLRVKVARLDGRVVNISPEFDDVTRVAKELSSPVKSVLAAAVAAAHTRLS